MIGISYEIKISEDCAKSILCLMKIFVFFFPEFPQLLISLMLFLTHTYHYIIYFKILINFEYTISKNIFGVFILFSFNCFNYAYFNDQIRKYKF